jgi:membrane protein YqaA with SNARE-associated domain
MITTIASVLGGMLGYAIGFFAFDMIQPWINLPIRWVLLFCWLKKYCYQ